MSTVLSWNTTLKVQVDYKARLELSFKVGIESPILFVPLQSINYISNWSLTAIDSVYLAYGGLCCIPHPNQMSRQVPYYLASAVLRATSLRVEEKSSGFPPTNAVMMNLLPEVMKTSRRRHQRRHHSEVVRSSSFRYLHCVRDGVSPPRAVCLLAGCNAIRLTLPFKIPKHRSSCKWIQLTAVLSSTLSCCGESKTDCTPNNWFRIVTFVPGAGCPATSSTSIVPNMPIMTAPWSLDTVTAICLIGFNVGSTSAPPKMFPFQKDFTLEFARNVLVSNWQANQSQQRLTKYKIC